MQEVFWERVDALLVDTQLGGYDATNRRIRKFKKQFFKSEEEQARIKCILENERRAACGEKMKKFSFELTDTQKGAVNLLTVVSIYQNANHPYDKTTAAKTKEYLKNALQDDVVKDVSGLETDIYKFVSDMADKIKNYDSMQYYKVVKEAVQILDKEQEREALREGDKAGDFYYLHIPIQSRYEWGEGWANFIQDGENFSAETKRLLPTGDWKFEPSSSSSYCDRLVNGRNSVYLHPMDFTIFAQKDAMEEIVEHFRNVHAFSFRVRNADTRRAKEIKNMTSRQVYDMYKGMEKEIRTAILKNVSRYPYFFELSEQVYDKFRVVNIADENHNIHHSDEIGWKFTEDTVERMIKENVLVQDNHRKLSVNKKEIAVDSEQKSRVNTRA